MPGGADGTPEPAGALATGTRGDVGAQSSDDRQPAVRADRAPRAALFHAVRVSGPAGGDRRARHPPVWMGPRSGPLALLSALPLCVVSLRPLPVLLALLLCFVFLRLWLSAGEPCVGGDVFPPLLRAAPAGETRHGRRPRKPLAPAPQCLVAAGGAAHVARPSPDVGGSTPEGIPDNLREAGPARLHEVPKKGIAKGEGNRRATAMCFCDGDLISRETPIHWRLPRVDGHPISH